MVEEKVHILLTSDKLGGLHHHSEWTVLTVMCFTEEETEAEGTQLFAQGYTLNQNSCMGY